MKKIYNQLFILVLAAFAGLSPKVTGAQATFDIETTSDNVSIINTVALPGNNIAILSWATDNSSVLLKVYDATGVVKTNTDITSLFDWPHTYHTSVQLNAIATAGGNIFISYSANSNSTGIQTYNARYILITDQGVPVTGGQLNNVDAGGSYTWHVILDRLSDGKIMAVWRRSQNENIVFRLFNPDGSAFNNEVAFAGAGTGDAQNTIYTVQAAAGKNGNFMVSLFYWTGNLRGYVFDNNGNAAYTGGGRAFDIDPTISSDYGNNGLLALANGNFAACWWLGGQNYLSILSNNGSTVVSPKNIGSNYYSNLFPVYTPGEEGFYTAEMVELVPGPSDPYSTINLTKYDQQGDVVSSTPFSGGYLIQPTFMFTPGFSGGYACIYSYYKSFTMMPFPMNMAMPSGDQDAKATTSDFSLNTLPVQLISFEAKRTTDMKVSLNWKTSSETNNHHFEIEKSSDGRHFTSIASVLSSGNSPTISEYSYTDVDNSTAHVFYRLKQYDHDGRFKDLGTRLVRNSKAGKLASVFPNPVTGNTVTILAGDQQLPLVYRITDAQGRTLKNGKINQSQQELSLDELKEGIYFLQVGAQTIRIKK